MKSKEIRCLNLDLEMRAIDNETEMIIEGYPVVFNSPATHGYTEIIASTAFDNTDMTDVVLRYNHNDSFICLARTRNKSLELAKDEKGLKMKATLNPNIPEHKSIYEGIKSGLLDKMSFAFTTRSEEWDYNTDTRTIIDIDKLYDVAVVDQPFYDSTSIYARSLVETEKRFRESKKLEQVKKELLEKLG
ncbi:MAG: HK97 family phage prohead protease [Ruminococcus sp.]|nr:HK97 family phage prohead protease [Ruminococcus sp.]